VADVFLSYAREDKETAHRLADALEARGFDVWWDAEIPPGETWDRMIERELAAARCAVVLWSRVSVAKTWVRTEATEAQKRSVLIPVLIDDVEQPIAFRLTQTVSLAGWAGEDDHRGFRQLLGAVERLVRDPAIAPDDALRDAEPEPDRRPDRRPDRQPERSGPAAKRLRWPWLAGAGAVAAAAVAGIVAIGEQKPADPPRPRVAVVDPVKPEPERDLPDFQPAVGADAAAVSDIPGKYPFASQRYLTREELSALSDAELRIMRNEIFARHGYIFKTDAMNRYFSRQPWYRPQGGNVIDRLSPIELANVTTIKATEKRR
jgi:hypothetical protein